MKIHYSVTSPFVRKCLVAANELGLRDRIELVGASAHPVTRDRGLVAINPLGQVPTLVTDEGAVLYDSRVIVEYLNTLAGGDLVPEDPDARWG
ncbi:partial glutathione S-transferase, partial [Gammaproteobacteria bacterium]